jgi:2-methylcitrate dehydratase PrpD
VFDALIDVVTQNNIKPSEIESLTAYGEAWAEGIPTFMNRNIERPYDAQWSFAHGIALAAHLVPPGKDWQDPANVYSESVMDLMSKVVWRSHPDWATAVSADPAARPTRVEVVARGTTFVGERSYPKGSRSPDPTTYVTNDQLVAKFRHNAAGAITSEDADAVIDAVLHLEDVDDLGALMDRLRPGDGR